MDQNTKSKGNAIIVDTNVLIHDPESIDTLREGGNTLIVPWVVITTELDGLKKKPDVGTDAREAIRRIEKIRKRKNPFLIINLKNNVRGTQGLNKNKADHLIVATAINVARENKKKKTYRAVKLLSKDRMVRLLARELSDSSLLIEDYHSQKVEIPATADPKEIHVPKDHIQKGKIFPYNKEKHGFVEENEGVICFSDIYGNWGKSFTAIRKESIFKIIPKDINAVGIAPFSINGNGPNWLQFIALGQLLDPKIKLVFLQGGAGTGKTLLAMASAIEQRKTYRQILVTRPMIHLDDEDNIGFLPGALPDKIDPWTTPIKQSISFIKEKGANEGLIKRLEESNKIVMQPLDYIRGMSYYRIFLVIDESQNLTPHQFKTIITRAGTETKIVFTGDLSQIDRHRRIDRNSSGLAYSISKTRGHKLVGVTTFNETVRSELADLGAQLL